MTARLVLASASPARTKLLADAGISHSVMVSNVDEDAVTAAYGTPSPRETALLLARAKAEAVAALPETVRALVLGCDSVFEFDGAAYGKPYLPEVAHQRLSRMSGSSGTLHTGHWLVDARAVNGGGVPVDTVSGPASAWGATVSTAVHFAQLDDAEIAAYVATGEPLQCAGSFTLDGRGGAFIERIEGDPHAVVGLSLSALRALLRSAGVSVTGFWG
jgi:septum formation protein